MKYVEFAKRPQDLLDKIKLFHFDVIHKEAVGKKMNNTEKEYKAIDEEHLKTYPGKEKCNVMSCVFRTKRLGLWVRLNLMIEDFKT